ncbi:hypothetical protein myaer102_04450 [Microcystis viridis NIES-102]|uniref:Uncharacterized protein n=1 Tax=Microcystis viridis NIES-102 TaxID=213615 RepID=A0A3G9JZX0_MICVR|nr:hypothetical protein myaer102_04450 [Microcystis viridis NIES-102]
MLGSLILCVISVTYIVAIDLCVLCVSVVLSTHSPANLLESGAADFLSQFEEGLKTGAMWTSIERLS